MAKVNYVRYLVTLAFFVFINIKVSISVSGQNFLCKQVGVCRCVQLDGSFLDISPTENFNNSGFKFLSASTTQLVYFYHPCSDFPVHSATETECSKGCTLCLFKANSSNANPLDPKTVLSGSVSGTFYSLAHATDAFFQSSEVEINLVFHSGNVTTYMTLECDESSDAKTALSVKNPNAPISLTTHTLVLRSPYSCFRNVHHDKHYMSGFGLFVIILLTIAAAYFFGGMLVLRHIKGATGTEMIPNYDFWVSVPSRIKSCFMRLTGRGGEGDSYERI